MTFKKGEHVQLKSGGAEMIVTRIERIGDLLQELQKSIDAPDGASSARLSTQHKTNSISA
jgi:hypothetical protein